MSSSNKRPLIFIILFLLLTNIGVLGYFLWYKKPPHKQQQQQSGPKGVGISNALQKEVGFNDAQVAEYVKLREEQWKKFKPMLDDVRNAKDSLYRLLSNETASDSMANNIATLVGEKQKAVDLSAYTHFKKVRTLCTPDQLGKYDSLIQQMMKKMGRPPKGGEQKKTDKEKK
jgi:hypothetical protein